MSPSSPSSSYPEPDGACSNCTTRSGGSFRRCQVGFKFMTESGNLFYCVSKKTLKGRYG